MEYSSPGNEFVGSPTFIIMVVVGVIILGVVLRLLFHSSNSKEYKHNPDD